MTDGELTEQTPESTPPSDPETLRRDIEQTRSELGATVEALSQKADVKSQVKEKVDEGKVQLRERQEAVRKDVAERPAPFAAGAAVGVGVLVLWAVRRRRR
jgi:paraquat-inducible protein B